MSSNGTSSLRHNACSGRKRMSRCWSYVRAASSGGGLRVSGRYGFFACSAARAATSSKSKAVAGVARKAARNNPASAARTRSANNAVICLGACVRVGAMPYKGTITRTTAHPFHGARAKFVVRQAAEAEVHPRKDEPPPAHRLRGDEGRDHVVGTKNTRRANVGNVSQNRATKRPQGRREEGSVTTTCAYLSGLTVDG